MSIHRPVLLLLLVQVGWDAVYLWRHDIRHLTASSLILGAVLLAYYGGVYTQRALPAVDNSAEGEAA